MERDCPSPHQPPEKGQVDIVRSLSTSSSSDSGSSSEAETEKEEKKRERAMQLARLKARVGTKVQATLPVVPFLEMFNTAVCILD